MIIAQHLIDRAGGLLHAEQEVNAPGWLMFDDGGVEIEVGEFLYGLVRATKPERILELGTRFGISAAFLALGLEQNGSGRLTTLEINGTYRTKAEQMLGRMGLAGCVHCRVADARDWAIFEPPWLDMILLDTELQFRYANAVRLWPSLKPGGWLIIHDLHTHMHQPGGVLPGVKPDGFGLMPPEFTSWIKGHELQSFHLRTPRGLYVAQKAAPDFHTTRVLTCTK